MYNPFNSDYHPVSVAVSLVGALLILKQFKSQKTNMPTTKPTKTPINIQWAWSGQFTLTSVLSIEIEDSCRESIKFVVVVVVNSFVNAAVVVMDSFTVESVVVICENILCRKRAIGCLLLSSRSQFVCSLSKRIVRACRC